MIFLFKVNDIIISFKKLLVNRHMKQTNYRNSLQWLHNEHNGSSNHQSLDCLFRCRSKNTSKFRVTGLCEGNRSITSGFPLQRASNAENVSIWWCHHDQFSPSSGEAGIGCGEIGQWYGCWCPGSFCGQVISMAVTTRAMSEPAKIFYSCKMRWLSSTTAKVLIKFQSDMIIQTTNLMA